MWALLSRDSLKGVQAILRDQNPERMVILALFGPFVGRGGSRVIFRIKLFIPL